MTPKEASYFLFGLVLVIALAFDLGLLSKKSKIVTLRTAIWQTVLWVGLSMAFCVFIWLEDGHIAAINYLSAYLMEWSLSIDNIFVFILIFAAFGVRPAYYARVLLIGILMAIGLRAIFIFIGVELVQHYFWVEYIFGIFLIYTGVKMFISEKEAEYDLQKSKVYHFLKRILPLTDEEAGSNFVVWRNRKLFFTTISLVIGILAVTDVIFAMDSIPAVLAISQDKLVVYTSNIFAVLGLRSLFFLLQGVMQRFTYLQQGVAIVLVFIGLKMLAVFFHFELPVYASLFVIILCLTGSVLYSLYRQREKAKYNPGNKSNSHE
jgi:TerC family integral membrane protein